MISLFQENRIIAYEFPACTTVKAKPCDVRVSERFKRILSTLISTATDSFNLGKSNIFGSGKMLRHAFISSFRRATVRPIDSSRLLSVPRRQNACSTKDFMSGYEYELLLFEKDVLQETEYLENE